MFVYVTSDVVLTALYPFPIIMDRKNSGCHLLTIQSAYYSSLTIMLRTRPSFAHVFHASGVL